MSRSKQRSGSQSTLEGHKRSKRARRQLLFETKREPLLPAARFVLRMGKYFLSATLLIAISLFLGMLGYWYFEEMSWVDAFANSAMILSGMGPLEQLKSPGGKLFAGCFALYSGLVLVLTSGLLLAPVVHRILHSFHVDMDETKE